MDDIQSAGHEIGLHVHPAAGVAVGASGTVKLSLSADGVPTIEHTAKVTIADRVDVADATTVKDASAPVGGVAGLTFGVRNAGQVTVDETVLELSGFDHSPFIPDGLAPEKRYHNCEYYSLSSTGSTRVRCRFRADLLPGVAYQLSAPLSFRVVSDLPAPSEDQTNYTWITRDDEAFTKAPWEGWNPGPATGPVLSLVAATSQTGQSNGDNGGRAVVKITGDNHADLSVIGAVVAGEAGATVDVTVALKNAGGARTFGVKGYQPVGYVQVKLPPGTTAVSVPEKCRDWEGDPALADHTCRGPGLLAGGQAESWTFRLRIDEKIADATGTVRLRFPSGELGTDANDSAAIVVNPGPGAGQQPGGGTKPTADAKPGASSSPIAGGAPESGGGGGELALTGANLIWGGGVGLSLVLLGAAGNWLSRRRRTRFVA
jgi:hypothetical protein